MSEEMMSTLQVGQQPDSIRDMAEALPLPGTLLAAQRHALGWTVEYVAGQLKLAPRQIISLETDNYEALPGISIAKGFVRAYAKVLRMDAAPLIAMLPQEKQMASTVLPIKKELSAPFLETRLRTIGASGKPYKLLAALALGAIVIGGLLYAEHLGVLPNLEQATLALQGKEPNTPVKPVVQIAAAGEPAATEVAGQPELMEQLPVEAKRLAASAPAAPVAAPASLIETPKVAVEQDASSQAVGNNDLVLQMREDSWLDIKRSNGSSVISRVAKAGATETFAVTEPIQLTIGNVHGVQATLRGVPLELKSGKANTIRLSLK